VVAIKVAEVPRIVAAAPALIDQRRPPQEARELATLPWLALRTYYRNEVSLTHAGSGTVQQFPIRPCVSTDSLYALRSAAVMGLGVCIASAWLVEDDLAQGRLVHLAPDWQAAPLPVHLVYPFARYYPARLRRFVELMRTAIPGAIGVCD